MAKTRQADVYIKLSPQVVLECEQIAIEYSALFDIEMTANDVFEAAANFGLNQIKHIMQKREVKTALQSAKEAANVH